MKFEIIDKSFKKYAEKDPEKTEVPADDKTFKDIYNELKKERLDLCYKEASKKRENYYQGDKKWKKKY